MSSKRYFTFEEAADIIMQEWDNESDDEIDLVVLPPQNGYVTDEEDIDDTVLVSEADNNVNMNVPPQFDTAGELEIHGLFEEQIDGLTENNDSTEIVNDDGFLNWNELQWHKEQENIAFSRTALNIEAEKKEELENLLSGKSCTELFEEFFDKDMIEYLVEQTNMYAHQNNRLTFSTNFNEMKAFIGFLLLTGYHHLPQEWMYWSLDPDVSIPFVRETFSRQTFRNIKQNLHLADNSENHDNTDKLFKVRPFFRKLNSNFMKFKIFNHNLSIDEQMIPYRGRHSCKMYIHGKPVKFGYKSWTLASSEGYVYAFDIYQGKSTGNSETNNVGLGGNVVLKLLSVVDSPNNHHVYFDNYFTSIQLISKLSNNNFFATGTIRDNRIRKVNGLKSIKDFKKIQRGVYDNVFERTKEILIVRWKDSAVVTVATNTHGIDPIKMISRYSREQKKKLSVTQPNVFYKYNSYMGGVDLADNFISNYRIAIRGKKWWWPLFSNFVDVALNNAWVLWRSVHPTEKKSLLDFRREVTIALMGCVKKNTVQTGHPSNLSLRVRNISNTGDVHTIVKNPDNKRKRCRICHSQTIYICNKCNLAVHAECMQQLHAN